MPVELGCTNTCGKLKQNKSKFLSEKFICLNICRRIFALSPISADFGAYPKHI